MSLYPIRRDASEPSRHSSSSQPLTKITKQQINEALTLVQHMLSSTAEHRTDQAIEIRIMRKFSNHSEEQSQQEIKVRLQNCLQFSLEQYHDLQVKYLEILHAWGKIGKIFCSLVKQNEHLQGLMQNLEENLNTYKQQIDQQLQQNQKLQEQLHNVRKRQQNAKYHYEHEKQSRNEYFQQIMKQLGEKQQENIGRLISCVREMEKEQRAKDMLIEEQKEDIQEMSKNVNNLNEEVLVLKSQNQVLKKQLGAVIAKSKDKQIVTGEKLKIVNKIHVDQGQLDQPIENLREQRYPRFSRTDFNFTQTKKITKDTTITQNKRHTLQDNPTMVLTHKKIRSQHKMQRFMPSFTDSTWGNKKQAYIQSTQIEDQDKPQQVHNGKGIKLFSRIDSLSSLFSETTVLPSRETLTQQISYNKISIGLMTQPYIFEEEESGNLHKSNVISSPKQNRLGEDRQMSKSFVRIPTQSSTCFSQDESLCLDFKKKGFGVEAKTQRTMKTEIKPDSNTNSSFIHGVVTSLVARRTHKKKPQFSIEQIENKRKQQQMLRSKISTSFLGTLKDVFNGNGKTEKAKMTTSLIINNGGPSTGMSKSTIGAPKRGK